MATYDHLSDAEVLDLAGGMGPGIIGEELHARAAAIRERTNNGELGPALIDPDFGKKRQRQAQANAEVRATRAGEPVEATVVGPWDHVTLSGAKQFAMQHGVSYAPRVKRLDLIDALIAAGVQPPAPPPPDPAEEKDLDEIAQAELEGDA